MQSRQVGGAAGLGIEPCWAASAGAGSCSVVGIGLCACHCCGGPVVECTVGYNARADRSFCYVTASQVAAQLLTSSRTLLPRRL